VHLVGFIVRIHRDVRPPERQSTLISSTETRSVNNTLALALLHILHNTIFSKTPFIYTSHAGFSSWHCANGYFRTGICCSFGTAQLRNTGHSLHTVQFGVQRIKCFELHTGANKRHCKFPLWRFITNRSAVLELFHADRQTDKRARSVKARACLKASAFEPLRYVLA